MNWLKQISLKQKIWLLCTLLVSIFIITTGLIFQPQPPAVDLGIFNTEMTITDAAPKLGVTGKSLAKELGLPIDSAKNIPLSKLGISQDKFDHAAEHILSHSPTTIKYYIFLVICLWGVVFLYRIGRPDALDINEKQNWYPKWFYILFLSASALICGFLLGKSPNPMEGAVKLFKTTAGLYPDPLNKAIVFIFFIFLAVIGNKIICGWACPFGALQELAGSLPLFRKKIKLPLFLTAGIRFILFTLMLLILFGVIFDSKGMVIYHYVNPFNLFNFEFESTSILLTVIIALLVSTFIYRPFCQMICPFGFLSWLAENISIFKIKIDHEKCIDCGACAKACPTNAAADKVKGQKIKSDCFSCARCLNKCPVDAISYKICFSKEVK